MSENTNHNGRKQSNRRSQTTGTTRRSFMKAASAGAVAAGLGTSMMGSASAAGINLPPLARDGNKIVDPSGNEVILRGVSIADPGEQSRDWRGQTAPETFELATDQSEGWYNRIIRVPIQAEFIAAGTEAPAPEQMPHGDDWGPLLPGAFDASDVEWYCQTYIDELVELGRQQGAYVMLDYHRHYPVFHNEEHSEYDISDDIWICSSDGGEDWRDPDVCGERGVLWHGEDQVDDIWNLIDDQNILEAFELDEDDIFLEPASVSNALDDELHTFWEVVADRYAEDMHVVFDVYNEPTGPYGGDWGGQHRTAGELSNPVAAPGEAEGDYDVTQPGMKGWYDLWVDRAQPWIDTVEDNAPGHIVTIGNPRWSQYTYWAPHNEFDAEHMCYTSHVYTQDDMRPLDEKIGPATEQVPVFFSEFGWMDHDGLVPTPWMDGSREEFGPEFEQFMESHDVHPICWCFDHSWEPNFFDHGDPGPGGAQGAPDADDWMDHLIDTTPGQFWHEYVQEKEGDRDQPVDGDTAYPDGDTGPNSCHGLSAGECYGDTDTPTPGEPQDTTGDGLYNDITGSGSTTTSDVTEFFSGFTDEYSDPQYYDFTGSGSVTTSDVVELFESI
ncbi:glycoside hydrolase family 5 protein [Halobacteria archaeon AArc-m2/3/4]|uniref:Glycoside hydrolase family 5 protein n=1 Tax=Natronoglomus mannanivorans TaxID=2979990 RepID=A0ABT2QCQ9_9EURY|nr:glycoside hydrolase family 5 protein [Halobacteria archaeon AArc-m2/3/4]